MIHVISEYINLMKQAGLYVSDTCTENVNVENLTYDSNAATPGTLFVCKGAAFKEQYLHSAIEKGAVVYISEKEYPDAKVPHILVSDIRKAMPYLAVLFYDDPGSKLNLTGLTGTKGKSTTAYYFKNIVDMYEASIGKPETGITSSIDTYDGVQFFESHITTPESMVLLNHFNNAVKSGIEYFTMEVSSQALKYDRVDLVKWDVGVFMNISEDHISEIEHPDFEDYFSSKLKFFKQVKKAFICPDCDHYERIKEASKAAEEVYTFGTKPECDVYGYDIRKVDDSIFFKVRCDRFDREFELTMPGLFNVQNALAAICIANAYNIPEEFIYEGLKTARSKGRMELFKTADKKVYAIVDYAHNKLSFEKLYESTFKEYPGRKVVTIFGCPGYKSYLRRRDIGTLAGTYSDKIYLVAEDPGEEPVEQISRDIAQYVEAAGNCPYEMIEDRGEAIRKAIFECTEPTILLITGKGDETRQKIGKEYIECTSDADYVKNFMAEYDAEKCGK